MNNVIFTNFGDSDPCCNIGDIWVQCDDPAKAEIEWKEAEKYRWHDLRKDPNDLPEKANDDSKSGYSKEVLIISSLFNEVWLGYMKLSDKKWFDSVDGELLSKPVMWKYIELPDENNILNIVKNAEKLVGTLEKQIPEKIKRRRILYDFNDKPYAIKGDCPRCGNGQLVSTLEQYCPKCGQKLDWSE